MAKVLDGFEVDTLNPRLHYNDSITIIPHGCNGLATFAGAIDARPWVEILEDSVSTPPNLPDCQWRLVPRRVYTESRNLKKIKKEGQWDKGRNLPWPEVPSQEDKGNLEALARKFMRDQKLATYEIDKKKNKVLKDKSGNPLFDAKSQRQLQLVEEVLRQLMAVEEEHEGNIAEEERRHGHTILYGDAVQLMHVSTQSYLSVSKDAAIEHGSKKIELVPEGQGSDACIFVVRPAFKTYSPGEPVSSGDLVVLQTRKDIGGTPHFIHMSGLGEAMAEIKAKQGMRSLQLSSAAVADVEEVNAATLRTYWRLLLFQSCAELHNPDRRLRAEDIVSFYHKESEAFLHLDIRDWAKGQQPSFWRSVRTSERVRKKSSWMFKVEGVRTVEAASRVLGGEDNKYRIKHLLSNGYLKRNGGALELTRDYQDEATLFTFKQFDRGADSQEISLNDLVYLRSADGAWLAQVSNEVQSPDDSASTKAVKAGGDVSNLLTEIRECKAAFVEEDAAPEREALMILPVRKESVASVATIQRALAVLKGYKLMLEDIGDSPDTSKPGDTAPQELGPEASQVVEITRQQFDVVYETLCKLVINSTRDSEMDPLSREGSPNRLMQKLLRENDATNLIMGLIALPFTKGVGLEWFPHKEVDNPRHPLKKLRDVLTMMYRLMKQMVKGDRVNGNDLFNHLELIKAHLGKGFSSNVTLKEMYLNNRRLLNQIKMPDIELFTRLLNEAKDPRYIDFLLSVSLCDDEPLSANQEMICELVLNLNSHLIPTCQLDTESTAGVRLGVHLPGTKDQFGKDFWIDVSKFNERVSYGGKEQDLAGLILTASTSKLNDQQKLFRYFIRCTNLFSKLALGRNQKALMLLLKNPAFCFTYDSIYTIISSDTIPSLVRARFVTMMMHLYVDRDPQTSRPQVLYTRMWSKVTSEESDLLKDKEEGTKSSQGPTLPICEKGFDELETYVLNELPKLGGAKECQKSMKPTLEMATFGELELILAQLKLCDWMVDFGFFVKDRNALDADFTPIQRMVTSIFAMLDTLNVQVQEALSREDFLREAVREQALELLLRLFNMRANYRISVVLDEWERMFQDPDMQKKLSKPIGRRSSFQGAINTEFGVKLFSRLDSKFSACIKSLFDKPSICPEDLGCDTYDYGKFAKDYSTKVLINLLRCKNTRLSSLAAQAIVQHFTQRARLVSDLDLSQVLVYPAAINVNNETTYVINRLTALKKHLNSEDESAYKEAMELLQRMTDYIIISPTNPIAIVKKNQRIMLNRELDEPVCDLLRLHLERDTSARDGGEIDADPAVNEKRREMFQACYDFLKRLCEHKHSRAQEKLFPLIHTFSDHMGIKDLNVADTLSAVVRNNASLCAQVPESLYEHFIHSILTWGRKPRWLSFFEVFISVNGTISKRNQDKILRLMMEESSLLDLDCDYTDTNFLSPKDERYGKKRLDLMIIRDHKRKVASLLKYHYVSIDMLAQCCMGKNPLNKTKVASKLPFETILDNILECNLKPDGSVCEEVDYDTVCYVKKVWVRLLLEVYLDSVESSAIRDVLGSTRIWGADKDEKGQPTADRTGLIKEWRDCVAKLALRLSDLCNAGKEAGEGGEGEAKNDAGGAGVKDDVAKKEEEEQAAKLQDEARCLFNSFDKDKSGDLSELELENALTEIGFTQSEVSEIMMAADEDSDGLLSFEEFEKGVVPVLQKRKKQKDKDKGDGVEGGADGPDGVDGVEGGADGPDLVLIGHRIALLGGEADEDVKDKHGEDVGSHYAYVMQILSAMQKFVNREDLSQLREDSPEREIIQQFYGEIVKLYPLVARLELKGAAVQIESLIICLNERGVHHSQSDFQEFDFQEQTDNSDDEFPTEEQFNHTHAGE